MLTYTSRCPPAAPLPGRIGLTDFVGETSDMPTPPAAATPQSSGTRAASMPAATSTSPFSAAGLGSTEPDPSVWSSEQQQQFMSALLGAAASGRLPMDGAEQQEARRRVASASSAAHPPSAPLPPGLNELVERETNWFRETFTRRLAVSFSRPQEPTPIDPRRTPAGDAYVRALEGVRDALSGQVAALASVRDELRLRARNAPLSDAEIFGHPANR